MFRSSRPDYIETRGAWPDRRTSCHCSGLPGRTTLRRTWSAPSFLEKTGLFRSSRPDYIETRAASPGLCLRSSGLFRSSRPDYIETRRDGGPIRWFRCHCSGLPGRTTLRLTRVEQSLDLGFRLFRSSRPDYIETLNAALFSKSITARLFRSSRPDYIETNLPTTDTDGPGAIVPVFQAGLH